MGILAAAVQGEVMMVVAKWRHKEVEWTRIAAREATEWEGSLLSPGPPEVLQQLDTWPGGSDLLHPKVGPLVFT